MTQFKAPLNKSRMRILSVETDKLIQMDSVLEMNRLGLEIKFCETVEEAYSFAAKYDPHVVICDLELPDDGAKELARNLRLEYGVTLPVIFSSHKGYEEWEEALEGVKYYGFLEKPFNDEDLLDIVIPLRGNKCKTLNWKGMLT